MNSASVEVEAKVVVEAELGKISRVKIYLAALHYFHCPSLELLLLPVHHEVNMDPDRHLVAELLLVLVGCWQNRNCEDPPGPPFNVNYVAPQ